MAKYGYLNTMAYHPYNNVQHDTIRHKTIQYGNMFIVQNPRHEVLGEA